MQTDFILNDIAELFHRQHSSLFYISCFKYVACCTYFSFIWLITYTYYPSFYCLSTSLLINCIFLNIIVKFCKLFNKKSSIVIRDSRFVNEFHILKATCKFCTRLSTFVMTFPFFPLLLWYNTFFKTGNAWFYGISRLFCF